MNGWPRVPIGEICFTTSGGTPSRAKPEYYSGQIPWVKSGDLNDGIVSTCDECVSELGLRNSNAKIFPKGTLLIALYGATVGKLGILGMDAATNQAICGITPSDVIDRKFLFYFLLSQRSRFVTQSIGGAQPNISQQVVRELSVPLPPLAEQHRIVDILDRATSIRRQRRQAQDTARQIILALFFKMFGDPATNPKGWPELPFGDLLTEPPRNGLSPSRAGKHPDRVLTLSAITSGTFNAMEVKESFFARPVAPRERVSTKDFLITRGNGNPDLVGAGAFPTHDMPGVAFPDTMIATRLRLDRLTPSYLATFWKTERCRQWLKAKAQTTNGTFKLNQGAIMATPILVPPLDVQCKFDQQLASIHKVIQRQSQAMECADIISASLASRLLG